jgi:type I restriction enzyme S subunit
MIGRYGPPIFQILRGKSGSYNVALIKAELKNNVDRDYLYYLLKQERLYRLIDRLSSWTSGQTGIDMDALNSFPVDLPPLPEQRKIADILGTWDVALEKLDGLIAAKARRKHALTHQLISGNHRLPVPSTRWAMRTLGELIDPITRPVPKPRSAFLAAGIRSHGKGVFLKPAFEPNGIALDELFEIRAGDLIVNITFAWEGAAAIVPEAADGALVSHRFPTFRIRHSEASLSFLRHYLRTKRFVFKCGLASPGGAGRNRVLSKSAFLAMELPVPSASHQESIGEILDTADAELRLLHQQRAALDQQKRSLMQQLLTGKKRVRV